MKAYAVQPSMPMIKAEYRTPHDMFFVIGIIGLLGFIIWWGLSQ